MKEIELKCTQLNEQDIEITTMKGDGFPPLLSMFEDHISLPLYESLGCLGCERMQREAKDRLHKPRPVERALIHSEFLHPGVSQQIKDGVIVHCPLLDDWNVHPDIRESIAPCKAKKQIKVALPNSPY